MTIDTIGSITGPRPADRAAERQLAGAAAAPGTQRGASASNAANANGRAASVAAPTRDMPTREEVDRALAELNESQQAKSQGLEFSVDGDTQRTVVKVIDQSTREVLRQIPSVEALEIAKALEAKSTRGVLIQQTA
jgi:flagellar protein FlaG